jgi:hypothetical protein
MTRKKIDFFPILFILPFSASSASLLGFKDSKNPLQHLWLVGVVSAFSYWYAPLRREGLACSESDGSYF